MFKIILLLSCLSNIAVFSQPKDLHLFYYRDYENDNEDEEKYRLNRVKSVTQWSQNDTDVSGRVKYEIEEYNESGKLTKQEVYLRNKKKSSTFTYKYNSIGKIEQKELIFYPEDIKLNIFYTYDSQKRVKSVTQYNDLKLYSDHILIYNDTFNILTEYTYKNLSDSSNTLSDTMVYYFNKDKYLIKYSRYSYTTIYNYYDTCYTELLYEKDSLLHTVVNIYDKNKNVIEIFRIKPDSTVNFIYKCSYNGRGLISGETFFDKYTILDRYEYKYDNNGQLIEERSYSGGTELSERSTYKYYKNGLLKEEITDYNIFTLSGKRRDIYTYEYYK